jgi:hypothetical protein
VTVVATAAVLAAAVSVAPSFAAPSFLTSQKAAHLYLTSKKASGLFLKKKAAGNTYVKKATAPYAPSVGLAAGTAPYISDATTAGYIPGAFTSFATKNIAPAVVTFSGNVICTATKPTVELACPIEVLVDGQKTGKVNIAPATAGTDKIVPINQSYTFTTVLTKGGHTVAVQYIGAKNVTFQLKGWNLAVQAYPQAPEVEETSTPKK